MIDMPWMWQSCSIRSTWNLGVDSVNCSMFSASLVHPRPDSEPDDDDFASSRMSDKILELQTWVKCASGLAALIPQIRILPARMMMKGSRTV
jgi:hypothetical protein